MSLSNVFWVGQVVYIETVHTPDTGQSGTPSSVTATVTVKMPDGTFVDPAPTATVTTDAGVSTVTWSQDVGDTSAAGAGDWYFRVALSGDMDDAYEGSFYVRNSQLV